MLDLPAGANQLIWPTDDFTRTPYEVYVSDEIFAREQQSYLTRQLGSGGLECELKTLVTTLPG